MAASFPWGDVVAQLDVEAVGQEALETLTNASSPALLPVFAAAVRALETTQGRLRGLNLLANSVDPMVGIAFAAEIAVDPHAGMQLSAAQLLAKFPNEPPARDALLRMLKDDEPRVRALVLRAIREMTLGTDDGAAARAALVVLPPEHRREANDLLDRLESAVKTLQDLGLDEAQHRIVDELVLPMCAELRTLFGATLMDAETLRSERKRGVLGVGGLMSAAKALLLAVPATANADEAASDVGAAAEALAPIAQWFIELF